MEVSEENLGRLVEMLTGTLSHDPAQRRAGEYGLLCFSLPYLIVNAQCLSPHISNQTFYIALYCECFSY